MRDFLTGGALTALYMLGVYTLNAFHPALPFIVFALVVIILAVGHMRDVIGMVKRGEITSVNFRNINWF